MRISDWSSDVCSSDLLAAIGLADVMRETDRGARLLRDTHPFLGNGVDRAVVIFFDGMAGNERVDVQMVDAPILHLVDQGVDDRASDYMAARSIRDTDFE